MVSGGKERSITVLQTDALWPSTGERCRAVVSRVRVSSLVFIERNVGGRKLNILVI